MADRGARPGAGGAREPGRTARGGTAGPADWRHYLAAYHEDRPGITERAFEHVRDPDLGTPHDWCVAGLPDRPGDVLDVACGSAPLQPRLEGRARSYLGVDLSEAELQAARDRGRGPVVLGDARRLPVADASVDSVVSAMGLMLVHPVDDALAEVARVLRPGGAAVFLLPAAGPLRPSDLRPLLALAVHLRTVGSMPQRLTARGLDRRLRDVGIELQHARRYRFTFPLRTAEDARLALRSLYTPSRPPERVAAAEGALARLAGPERHLPLPLLRVVARRSR